MISLEEREKIYRALEEEREPVIQLFQRAFSFPYTPDTEVILVYVGNRLFDFEMSVRPCTSLPLFDLVPYRYEENGEPVYEIEELKLKKFRCDTYLDESRRYDVRYAEKVRPLFANWLSDLLRSVSGYHRFPYPIYLSFSADYPHYYNLRTKKFVKYKVSQEDQRKIIEAFQYVEDEITRSFQELFTYSYTRETEAILLEAKFDQIYGFSFDFKPITNQLKEVPLYYDRSGKPVFGYLHMGTEIHFEKFLDVNAIIHQDLDAVYSVIMERLFVKWLGKFLKTVKGYRSFPYPIYFTHESLYPHYYDIRTGKLKKMEGI
ncbi:hypothetical protein [Thermoflavimicrobium dichotomicum]|uniref:Uncharacterized protein n=1 Tax=Thermoflavimicrobium dichotomicum TaxID=46223 RepID=A0A1I3SNM4_9BACL|nr:hypothetical protein [Thermoflavimicrobium dichotomicum]SFJ58997.1 hypothetical protein SAMN05421852_11374 [Thermoflavimicrobium dichotomicum]